MKHGFWPALIGWLLGCGLAVGEREWPSWLEIEARTVQGWDSNVYWMDVGRWAGKGSWFSQVGLHLAGRWQWEETLRLQAGVEVEPVFFLNEPLEDHVRTAGFMSAQGASGEWRWEASGSIRLVEGDDEPPVWDGQGGAPALGGYEIRDRRDQWSMQHRAMGVWHSGAWQLRLLTQSTAQDFMTRERALAGCQNYVDRSEMMAGWDIAHDVMGQLAAGTGVRLGWQEQAELLDSPIEYSNQFVRPVLVVKGSPMAGWEWDAEGGLDFRAFTGKLPPGERASRTEWVYRVAVKWDSPGAGRWSLEARQVPFPSSSGRGMFRDATWGLEWHYVWSRFWQTAAGLRVQENDFFPAARRDRVYRPHAGGVWQVNETWKLSVDYEYAWSESEVPGTPAREFIRHRVTVGAACHF